MSPRRPRRISEQEAALSVRLAFAEATIDALYTDNVAKDKTIMSLGEKMDEMKDTIQRLIERKRP